MLPRMMSSRFIVELKRVFDRHPRRAEICNVSRRHSQLVSEGRGGDETVFDWHGPALPFQPRQQICPSVGGDGIEIEDVKARNARAEPLFQAGAPAAGREDEDAVLEFAKDDRADGEITLVAAKPCQRGGVWRRLRRLAQDVGINEIFQRESVDSEGMG